jgi:hypothetical protein
MISGKAKWMNRSNAAVKVDRRLLAHGQQAELELGYAFGRNVAFEDRREDAGEPAQQWTGRTSRRERAGNVFNGSAALGTTAQGLGQVATPGDELLHQHVQQDRFAALEVPIDVRLGHLGFPGQLIDAQGVHVRNLEQKGPGGVEQVASTLLLLLGRARAQVR